MVVMTLNRNQNRFQMYAVNPKSAVSKLIYTDESQSWVDINKITKMFKINGDNFVIPSEKSG